MEKKMKRHSLLALVAASTILLVACGGGSTPSPSSSTPISPQASGDGSSQTTSENVQREKIFIKVAGGASTGVGYIAVTSCANIVNKTYSNYVFAPEISTGSAENVRMMSQKILDLGTVMTDVAQAAYNGEREFDSSTKESINFVMGGFVTSFNMFVPKDSPINSIADLKGKKCGVSNGTMKQLYWPLLLEYYGMTEEDVKGVGLSLTDICNGIADGTLDFGIHVAQAPAPAISDLAMTKGLKMISFEAEIAEKISKDHPYFTKEVIPANVYKSESDVQTLGTRNTFCARPDLSEQFVYDFLSVVLESEAELTQVHPAAGSFNKENALKGQIIPMHPGAERYYKEKGMIK